MDWNKGYTASYFVRRLDPRTWRELERYEITGGSVARTQTDLRQSADLDFHGKFSLSDKWIRVSMAVRQGHSSQTIPLFTGIVSTSGRDINGTMVDHEAEAYSVLYPVDKSLLPLGWYAGNGANGALLVKSLLSVTPAPVVIHGTSPSLAQAIVAEQDETRLTMADKVLTAIGWRLYIDGEGTIHLAPKATEPSAYFSAMGRDVIEPKISEDFDWFEIPNVFRAISDDMTATARDDAVGSPLSTVNRGMEIWEQETSCDLNSGESIAEYALRRLKELQQFSRSYSYDRRFDPNVNVSDLVNLNYPVQGITGNYMVRKQTIKLDKGGKTSEEVVEV